MGIPLPDATETDGRRRRRLRAIMAADVANFGGLVSVDETNTLDTLWVTRRIALEELAAHGGWLFGMPGDGIFALFESAVDAVRCALSTQMRLAAMPKLDAMRLRIGVHLGEVLFKDDLPFGEALVIASRLEGLADPGGILVSAAVMEAVAPRISAAFRERGVFNLKHSPRRVATFSVSVSTSMSDLNESLTVAEPLDRTVLSVAPDRAGGRIGPAPDPPSPALPEIVSLPKAAQLVVPVVTDGPASRGTEPAPGHLNPALIEPCLTELTQVLTTHLGPVAGMLIRRYAADFADPLKFLDALSQEIPAKAERLQFLLRARQILSRQP